MLGPLIVGAAVLGLIVSTDKPGSGSIGEWPDAAGLDDLEAAMDAAGLPDDWKIFLAATAYGESKWNTDVGLGPNDHPGRPPWMRPSKASAKLQNNEARAACKAYDKNAAKWFANSPWPPARYCFGSGGWFGFLPTYGLISGFKATPELIAQIDPWDVADPLVSLVMALGYARGLMRWKQFAAGGGTWLTLRVGWGRPANMSTAQSNAKVRAKFASHLAEIGVAPSWMDQRVPQLVGMPKGGQLLALLESQEAAAQAALDAEVEGEWQEAA